MTTSQELRREGWSWAAQVIWIAGTLSALIAGYRSDPIWGLAILCVTLLLTIALGWGAARWNAFPAVFGALALQALACGSTGAAALDDPIGRHWFWWDMTSSLDGWQLLIVIAPSFVPALLLAMLLRSQSAIHVLRRGAASALPVVLVASVVLLGLAAYRAARLPTAERYADTLPVVAKVAGIGEACREGRLLENGERYCESAPQMVAGYTTFYACSVGEARRWCRLKLAGAEASSRPGYHLDNDVTAHDVVRHERLGLLIRDGKGLDRFPPTPESPLAIGLHDLRHDIAPPTSWLLLAALGLGVAILAQLGRHAFVRLLGAPTRAHAEWHTRLRGDLSVVSIATLAVTHAFLVAALVRGFLI